MYCSTRLSLFLFTAAVSALPSCTISPAEEKPDSPCICDSQTYLTGAVLFTQESAEYKALCLQAYNAAAARLPELSAKSERPAVVLDLDETVLDNSPYSAWQVLNGKPYSPETWVRWVQEASAEEVPGAGGFLHFADSLGLRIFYISNRDTSQLPPTMTNMEKLGLPQLRQENFLLKTETSDKTERRNAVRAEGYDIVMLIGDNLGDHSGRYDKPATSAERSQSAFEDAEKFGAEYIVLPNTIYGTWEGTLYNYDRSISDAERCRLRREHLAAPEL